MASRTTVVGILVALLLIVSVAAAIYVSQSKGPSQGPNPLSSFGKVNSTVDVGSSPYGLACNIEGGACYVAVSGADEVAVVDNQSRVIGDISIGGATDFLAFDPSDSLLYASLIGNNSVAVINTTLATVVGKVPVQAGPGWLAFDPASGAVYCVNRESNSVTVISGESVIATIPLAGLPFAAAYDLFDGNMYVTDNQGAVFVINGATNSLIRSVQVGSPNTDLLGIAYNGATMRMYATSNSDNSVYILNSTKVTGMIVGFDAPTGIAFSLSSSAEMFVVNSGNGTVSAAWDNKFANFSVGSDPREVAYDPSTSQILVTNYGGTTVSLLST